ncbi:MAG: hypothetical protein ACREQ5_00900 [Candidatus Dormibacteria bacterium]
MSINQFIARIGWVAPLCALVLVALRVTDAPMEVRVVILFVCGIATGSVLTAYAVTRGWIRR